MKKVETMDDLISRQDAVCAIEEYEDRLQMVNWEENPNVPYKVHALNWAVNTIRELPSVEPERKKGRWRPSVDKWGDIITTVEGYTCSECGFFNAYEDNYCPNCGADMRGEEV